MKIDPALIRRALERPALFHPRPWQSDAPPKPAAVCVPIAFEPEPIVYAVLRSRDLRDHAGEVGFPGGKVDAADADLRATARRELSEEVAIEEDEVELLGSLMPVPVITGRYLIHPFVGALATGARPTVRATEIAAVLKIPVIDLLTGRAPIEAVQTEFAGNAFLAPHFRLANGDERVVLYGASAFILWELLLRIAAELAIEIPKPTLVDEYPWADRYYSKTAR